MTRFSIFSLACRLLIAAAFIASGLLKLYPVEFFENDLLIHHLAPENLVVFESRLLIASELILGVGILFCLRDKLFVPLSIIMLALYTIYLVVIIALEGNSGNCGCFGDAIVLTPLEGIVKNVVLGLLLLVVRQKPIKWPFRFGTALMIAVFLVGIAMPFILNPVFFPEKIMTDSGEKSVLPLDRLYENELETPPAFDIRKDKQIVAFLLLTCEHCKLAAKRLEAIKQNHPQLPIRSILCGKDEDLEAFRKETRLETIPYAVVHSLGEMIKIAGPDFPAVYFLDNGVAEAKLGFFDITSESMIQWYDLKD